MNTSVAFLRRAGFKVRVNHFRLTKNAANSIVSSLGERAEQADWKENLMPQREVDNPSHIGGRTVIEITTPEGKELVGDAICRPPDYFNRKLGVRIALGRAFKEKKVD